MVVVSAAQQSQFFEQISQGFGFWGGIAEGCALIGFTVAVLGGVLRKISLFPLLVWALVMIILFVAPINAKHDGARSKDPLFFTTITPEQYPWTRTPYQTFHAPEIDPENPDAAPEPKTPIDDLRELAPMKKGKPFYLFTPQLALMDTLNRVRTAVGQSFVSSHEGYKAPVADFSIRHGDNLKPLAGFLRLIFGSLDGGTYSALLPMILSFLMVVMIVCTPFVLMMAVMLPHWAPSLLLLTVGGVAYTKIVEVMFAMVHGILGIFLELGKQGQPREIGTFNEVLLGLGYLLALLASVWLVFKVRKTGQSAHNLLQDFIRESKAASFAQKQAAQQMMQHTTTRSLQGAGFGVGGGQQALNAPLQQLPFDAGRHEALRQKATQQKAAEELRPAPPTNTALAEENLQRAFAKTQQDALQKAQETGVPKEARAPRPTPPNAGQKAETVEPALSKVAKTFGGTTPEELGQSYQTATQLFTTGALSMRLDDHNQLRVEINLNLEVMQTLSPDLQEALTYLQKQGHITRTMGADNKPFFALAE